MKFLLIDNNSDEKYLVTGDSKEEALAKIIGYATRDAEMRYLEDFLNWLDLEVIDLDDIEELK